MSTVRLDKLADATLTEENGEIVAAKRSALVTVSKAASGGVFFAALAESGVPQPDEALNSSLPQVRVIRRDCTIVGIEGSDAKVDILIEYEIQRDEAEATHSLGASLQQITTQLDRNGQPITVEHAGDVQGAEITVLQPQRNIQYPKAIATNDPAAIQDDWIGKVNADTWQGGAPGTWLVTDVQAEPKYLPGTAGTPRYSFDFEFEYNPDGWDPSVVYKDPEGKIPETIVEGVGIVTVPWYTAPGFSRNFAPDFPATG